MSHQARVIKQYNHIVDELDAKLAIMGVVPADSRKKRIAEMLFEFVDTTKLDAKKPLNYRPKCSKWITVRSPTITNGA
jgi:hypothetical protein